MSNTKLIILKWMNELIGEMNRNGWNERNVIMFKRIYIFLNIYGIIVCRGLKLTVCLRINFLLFRFQVHLFILLNFLWKVIVYDVLIDVNVHNSLNDHWFYL